MEEYRNILKSLPQRHDRLVCIDSDGTVFDTMEAKHRCFRDSLIRTLGLHEHDAALAAEVWKFVNLHSIHRGENRFRSLLLTLDYLRERGVPVPDTPRLRRWVTAETKLGNPALKALLDREPSEEMDLAYQWSRESDKAIEATVRGIAPFPHVREALSRAAGGADVMVVSHTPCSTLVREWTANDIDHFTMYLAGQECGSKAEHIRYASEGKYPPERILMIGDSPGDLSAADANHALFFPIIPGKEEASWRELAHKGLDLFFGGCFAGDYQERLLEGFRTCLPSTPPWRRRAIRDARFEKAAGEDML